MPAWLAEALRQLPTAALNPMALAAYLAAIIAGVLLSSQLYRNRTREKLIHALPKDTRDERVREIIGQPLPKNITAEQWLRHQRQKLFLYALGILCVTFVVVFSMAVWTGRGNEKPSPPSPQDAQGPSGSASGAVSNASADPPRFDAAMALGYYALTYCALPDFGSREITEPAVEAELKSLMQELSFSLDFAKLGCEPDDANETDLYRSMAAWLARNRGPESRTAFKLGYDLAAAQWQADFQLQAAQGDGVPITSWPIFRTYNDPSGSQIQLSLEQRFKALNLPYDSGGGPNEFGLYARERLERVYRETLEAVRIRSVLNTPPPELE